MEALYRTHDYLLRNLSNPIQRSLFGEIDFSAPLIGIYGCRGVGKTTFLLDYAARTFGSLNRKCLYVNLNNFLFTPEASWIPDGAMVDDNMEYPVTYTIDYIRLYQGDNGEIYSPELGETRGTPAE